METSGSDLGRSSVKKENIRSPNRIKSITPITVKPPPIPSKV